MGDIGGCYVTIGRGNSSVIFLHGVMGNNTSGDCKVRITGLTKVPRLIVGHTGSVIGRLSTGSVARAIGGVSIRKRTSNGGGGPRLSRISLARVSLFSAMGSSSVVRRLQSISVDRVAPVSTLGGLCRLRGGIGGH